MHGAQVNLVPVHKLNTIFWHLSFIDKSTAGAVFVEKAVIGSFALEIGMKT